MMKIMKEKFFEKLSAFYQGERKVTDPDFLQLEFHQFHAILDLNDPFQTRQF
jgi:hypothetical protein